MSMWRDGLELVQGVRTEDGTETDKAIISKMAIYTERGFSVRIVVVPRAVETALIFVVAAPMCLDKLKTILDKTNLSGRNPLIPTVGSKQARLGTSMQQKHCTYLLRSHSECLPRDGASSQYSVILAQVQ